ncbi:MAG: sigma-70 family RNA polymerase sigma factor [Blastocatellia bacterium]|jgi:RNA polymerase sigma-70 factor (ECF subfamily)|nr:sigma-70 family RNA polymerase sigma factor [Blastocatellia bacterium]MBK6428526.1 sigma-70 family RNA polymerase sigma factor [Blastocatellia bacterium]
MAGDVVNIALTTGKLGACPATDARDDVLEQAIVRARRGDLEAFDLIIRRSERRVVSVAWRILGNEDDARDVAQEIFLRVFRYLGTYRPGESFSAWLYRIAINACRDARRAGAVRAAHFAPPADIDDWDPAGNEEPPDDALLRTQRRELIGRALSKLAGREREAFVLRDLEGLTTEEVAEALGMKAATVRGYVSTARAKVRSYCSEAIAASGRAGGLR